MVQNGINNAGTDPPPQGWGAPHQVEVVGPLATLTFPNRCVKCGGTPGGTLTLSKMYWQQYQDSTPGGYIFDNVYAPFCAACLQAHARERGPLEAGVKQKLLWKWLIQILPFVFPLACCLFFVRVTVPIVVQTLAHHRALWEVLLATGICAFFALIGGNFFWMIYERGQQLIFEPRDGLGHYIQVERGILGCRFIVPVAPTSAERALDFTSDCSQLFDRERHQLVFENTGIAAEFTALNANRKWDPTTPKAQKARMGRWIVMGLFVLFALYEMLKGLFH